MPKELINDETQQRWHTEVSWRRKPERPDEEGTASGHVQIATVNLDSPFHFPDREHAGSWEAGERFDGWRVTLDEAGIDRLIKTLHKAKRQAFSDPDDDHTLRDVTALGDEEQRWTCVRREHFGRRCQAAAYTRAEINAVPSPIQFAPADTGGQP